MRAPRLRLLAPVIAAVSLAGCGAAPSQSNPAASPSGPGLSTSPAAVASASATFAGRPPVAVIVMENRSYADVAGLPYIRTLAGPATALTGYHAVAHPSLPNYLALTSGQTWGITDDGYHVLPEQDLGDQLTAAGVPWRAYMESMGSDCRVNSGEYAVKHDPFAYYGGRCPPSVVPFGQMQSDLAGATPPRFIWITPDLCHDMHDCSSTTGDAWLRATVPALLASPAMAGGVLFITWDEDDGSGSNQVLTLVLGARHALTPSSPYTHVSLLATVEDLLGLPRLAATRGATAIALG